MNQPLRQTVHEIEANKARRRERIQLVRVDSDGFQCSGCDRPFRQKELMVITDPTTATKFCIGCIMFIWNLIEENAR